MKHVEILYTNNKTSVIYITRILHIVHQPQKLKSIIPTDLY
jgi:hypothetical protein